MIDFNPGDEVATTIHIKNVGFVNVRGEVVDIEKHQLTVLVGNDFHTVPKVDIWTRLIKRGEV